MLHVIISVSNPAHFTRRVELTRQFVERIEGREPLVRLYIAEIVYGDDATFQYTEPNHPRHLQLRSPHALWHKENSINLAVRKLLPSDWRVMAWVDADIEFLSPTWAADTLALAGTTFDVLQLFDICDDMDIDGSSMGLTGSAGYRAARRLPYLGHTKSKSADYSHPGYAWAITRPWYGMSASAGSLKSPSWVAAIGSCASRSSAPRKSCATKGTGRRT